MKLFSAICFIVCFLVAGYLFQPEKSTRSVIVTETEYTFTPVDFAQLNGFNTDNLMEALPAISDSCAGMKNNRVWNNFCKKLSQQKFSHSNEIRSFLKTELTPYAVAGEGLFTGYFLPEIEGSLVRTKKFNAPVLGLPSNLIQIDLGVFNPKYSGEILFAQIKDGKAIPYLTRKEIENGKSDAKPIAWMEHKADLFTMQVQGSGIMHLQDGSRLVLAYAGNNGHKFYGIGSDLAQKGIHSMQDIRQWLIENPIEADRLMHKNPRYIFFKKAPHAVGSLGVPLTEKRSMAVDPAYIPLGSLLWLDTVDPDGKPMQRLMAAHDTGTAIKGAVRGDFFWGIGEKALKEAGRMRSKGTYFILLPKDS